MKRVLMAAVVLVVAITVTPFAQGDDIQARPPGVAANDWVPISERVGFVLVHSTSKVAPRIDPQVLMMRPAAPGYFMLKGASGWARIIVVEPERGPGDAG